MSNGRVITSPGQLDELHHGHRTALRSSADDIALGPVKRHEPPQLAVLKFVLPDALEGGVTRTFNRDIHGKSLSSCLFKLELPECSQRGQIDG